jgi:hypothetical protein
LEIQGKGFHQAGREVEDNESAKEAFNPYGVEGFRHIQEYRVG